MSTDSKRKPGKCFSRIEQAVKRLGVADAASHLMRMQDRFHDVGEQMALEAFAQVCAEATQKNWGSKRVKPRKQKNPKRFVCKK